MAQSTTKKGINVEPIDLSVGLFDKIISVVALEKEKEHSKKIVYALVLLLLISVIAFPFSWNLFMADWRSSGAEYFISTGLGNMRVFLAFWQDFTFSILESLPVIPMILFVLNIALLLFTVRLFLYKKGFLLKYLRHNSL